MAHINFMDLQQEKYQDIQDFRDQYMSVKKVCDELELTFGHCESDARELLKTEGVSELTEEQLDDVLNRVEEEHHAIIFLYKSDRQRFGKYITEKENEILQKKDPFPKTVEDMCRVLEGWKNDNRHNRFSEANDGVAFATTDTAGTKGKNKNKKVTCFKCKKQGHYANKCKEVSDEDNNKSLKEKKSSNKKGSNFTNHGQHNKKKANEDGDNGNTSEEEEESSDDENYKFAFLQHDVTCSIHDKAAIPKTFDSQSTVDVFSNPKLPTNIRDAKKNLTLYCNAGKAIINKKGDLKGYGTVWFYPEGIANILSLGNVKKKHRITYDSSHDKGFLVFKADGTARAFRPSKKGLFFSDVKNDVAHTFVNTVENNKTKYTVKEYSDTVRASSLQNIIGRPSTQDYIKYVERNMIPNCPINKADILRAEDIFGANIGSLQGKTTRKKSERIVTTIHELPTQIIQRHGNVTIEVDIMYVNGIPFVVTTSRSIHFCMAEMIKNEKSMTIAMAIKQVLKIYHRHGFKVQFLLGDGQFEHIKKYFVDTDLTINITGLNEHVPAIERAIRTIKERIRAIVNQLPFKAYPHRLIVEMVYNVVFWLNVFPHKDDVHEVMSPRSIVTGLHINHDKHCALEFGSYVQIHEEHDNSMLARTSGAIALKLTGNIQGSHYFLNVNSDRRVAWNNWTALPMPNEIIHMVHRLTAACRKYKGIVFTDSRGKIIDDNSPENDVETVEITEIQEWAIQ